MTSTTTFEIDSKFTPKKSQSVLLAESYSRLNLASKALRVGSCGSFLTFLVGSDHSSKLIGADFCKDRLCPMCAWRRSLKIYGNVSSIMDLLGEQYRYIFLTLTVPNCSGGDLCAVISRMNEGFGRLLHRKKVKNVCLGYFRALEITRNSDTGLYHPHFHTVLAVRKSYFKKSDYLKQAEWLQLWRDSVQDQSITQVDVRIMKDKHTGSTSKLASAIAESAKYAVKSADYLFKGDPSLTDSIVDVLGPALFKRRLIAFGGVFAEARASLALDDEESGDLIHINESIRDDIASMIVSYQWSAGAYRIVSCEDFSE